MRICPQSGVRYQYSKKGLFIEIKDNIYFIKLTCPLPIDNNLMNLSKFNIFDIEDDIYLIYRSDVYKYAESDIRYWDGDFFVKKNGIRKLNKDATVGAAVEDFQWADAISIKMLGICNHFGTIEYYCASKDLAKIYTRGRQYVALDINF